MTSDSQSSESPSSGRDRTPAQYYEGDVIDDRYEVIALLGEGGSASVYRVVDREIRSEFALKVYNSTIGEEAALRELHSLFKVSDLRHIVRVFDVARTHTEPRRRYLKMEFVDGTTLDELCAPGQTPLEPDDLHHIGDQLLAALVALHPDAERIEEIEAQDEQTYDEYRELSRLKSEGLVHRDIKPENLVLDHDNVLKLLDFNIASRPGTIVKTQSATPGYVPPDADVTRWDVTVDLFAAGVVLFQLATLEHPFVERSVSRERHRLADLRSGLPDRLEQFFDVALAATRDERYPDARAMRAAWNAALGGGEEPPGAESPMPTDYTPAPVRQAEAHRADVVDAAAEEAGLGGQLAQAREVAGRHGLNQRTFVRSLMLGPPDSGSTVLVNIEFHGDGLAQVFVNDVQFRAVYRVDEAELSDRLAPPGKHRLTGEELRALLERLDALLADRPAVGSPKLGGDQQRIVDLICSDPDRTFTSEEVAAELELSKRRVGKRLSTLVGDGCPAVYQGRVIRTAPDRYRAVPGR